jgi:hypothetical protein
MGHANYNSLVDEARRLGLEDIEIDWTRRHAHLHASLKGERCVHYVLPKTPSCSRSLKNAVAGLRRQVRHACGERGIALPGSSGKCAEGPRIRPRRARGPRKAPKRVCSHVAPGPGALTKLDKDPWSALGKLREVLAGAVASVNEPPAAENLFAGAAARARRNGQW